MSLQLLVGRSLEVQRLLDAADIQDESVLDLLGERLTSRKAQT